MSEITPMDSSTFLAVEQCLYRLKLCVRLSPDGTYKPEGERKMTREEFCSWVQREMLKPTTMVAVNCPTHPNTFSITGECIECAG